MRPEPVEGLLGALVTTEGGQPGQPPTAIGAAEAADRHRGSCPRSRPRIEADPAEELLAELGFDRPQVRRLADEGGAVHTPQGREPVTPVAAEVLVQALVGVDAPELADAFNGQDLAVRQDRLWAALAEPPAAQPVIDQAVDRDEQRRSIHARPPYAW
jgi:hypothetical protein